MRKMQQRAVATVVVGVLRCERLMWMCVYVCVQELRLYSCNDLLGSDMGLWSLAAQCPNLQVLCVEGLNCRIPANHAGELAR